MQGFQTNLKSGETENMMTFLQASKPKLDFPVGSLCLIFRP